MRTALCSLVMGVFIVTVLAAPSRARDVVIQEDGSTVWQAGVDGVEIEWNPDGSVKRIYSRWTSVRI